MFDSDAEAISSRRSLTSYLSQHSGNLVRVLDGVRIAVKSREPLHPLKDKRPEMAFALLSNLVGRFHEKALGVKADVAA